MINKLQFDEFQRAIGISKNDTFSLLLGAGCSINSDIPSAEDCIWEWKRDIYKTNNSSSFGWIDNYKNPKTQEIIQNWLNNQGIYPERGCKEEYSFYAYKCYPIDEHRRQYFQKICSGKKPSIGYKLIPLLARKGMLDSVWTTNLDDLVVTACIGNGIQAIEITLDSVQRLNNRPQNRHELPVIKLHGDFKYGDLKNTEEELLNQDKTFRERLIEYVQDKHLIVLGYSGRDTSLMDTLKEAYSKQGGGILYWCGYGDNINSDIAELIQIATKNGRRAFYIPTDGFDSTLRKITQIVVEDDNNLKKELLELHQTSNINDTITPFDLKCERVNKLLKSNIFRISFPDEVFVFDVSISDKPWKFVDERTLERNDISAVPYNKQIWAFGRLDIIKDIFKDVMNSDIQRKPLANIKIYNTAVSRIESIDLIEINFENNIKYASSKIHDGKVDIDGFSVSRGTCIQLSSKEALLWAHGVIPSVINPNWNFYPGGRYIPKPLRIIKHYGTGSLEQIANEILGLTKMNWNSLNMYSQLPATISSSNDIARIGKLIGANSMHEYDYRYFI